MSNLPQVFKKGSIRIDVEKSKIYYWCSCGLSNNQPFCDNSHKNTGFTPVKYIAEEDKIVSFCGCKYSKKGAICDGSHKFIESND